MEQPALFSGGISDICPYGVGDIYITLREEDPAERWPETEWEKLPGGHCIVAAGTNAATGTAFALGATGGEETHKLTTEELASHAHQIVYSGTAGGVGWLPQGKTAGSLINGLDTKTSPATNGSFQDRQSTYNGAYVGDFPALRGAGSSKAFNIFSPYMVCYIYQRVR